jgi:pimeloyl-ACP methyl ester carboxylesterase
MQEEEPAMIASQPRNVTFESQGVVCRGVFTWPDHAAERPPLVIMAHGFGGTCDRSLPAYAAHFERAGIATLRFDYRHFGASDGTPRQLLVPRREVADYHAALAFARAELPVDTARIALWGTSFSGGTVLVVAAEDGAVAATVSQCPMLDGRAAALAVLRYAGLGHSLGMVGRAVADFAGAAFGAAPRYVPVVARPGQLAAMSSEDAFDGMMRILPDLRNEVTARTSLLVSQYRPIAYARRVKCPSLIQVCEKDSVAPVAAVERAIARMPRAEVVRYPIGHFEPYVDADFVRSVSDQTAFLCKHLEPRAAQQAGARA